MFDFQKMVEELSVVIDYFIQNYLFNMIFFATVGLFFLFLLWIIQKSISERLSYHYKKKLYKWESKKRDKLQKKAKRKAEKKETGKRKEFFEYLSNRWIIQLSGLQGSGKTRLMSSMGGYYQHKNLKRIKRNNFFYKIKSPNYIDRIEKAIEQGYMPLVYDNMGLVGRYKKNIVARAQKLELEKVMPILTMKKYYLANSTALIDEIGDNNNLSILQSNDKETADIMAIRKVWRYARHLKLRIIFNNQSLDRYHKDLREIGKTNINVIYSKHYNRLYKPVYCVKIAYNWIYRGISGYIVYRLKKSKTIASNYYDKKLLYKKIKKMKNNSYFTVKMDGKLYKFKISWRKILQGNSNYKKNDYDNYFKKNKQK